MLLEDFARVHLFILLGYEFFFFLRIFSIKTRIQLKILKILISTIKKMMAVI